MTAGDLDSSLLGRIVRPVDYVRVLATPMRLRSPHFAVHHLDGRPLALKQLMAREPAAGEESSTNAEGGTAVRPPVVASLSTELSTGFQHAEATVVDDLQAVGSSRRVEASTPKRGPNRWLGLVVPKRHAKRAVTRTLVKRQIRSVAAACAPQLEPGLWVVRQRSPFDPKQYPSAASEALKEAARAELHALFDRAVRGERDRVKPRPPGAAPCKGKSSKPTKLKAAASAPPVDPAEDKPCAA